MQCTRVIQGSAVGTDSHGQATVTIRRARRVHSCQTITFWPKQFSVYWAGSGLVLLPVYRNPSIRRWQLCGCGCLSRGRVNSALVSADGCWLASKRQHLSKDNHSSLLEVLFGFARERTFFKEKELEGLHCRGESLNLARPSPSETRDRPLRVIKCLSLLFEKETCLPSGLYIM